MPTSAKGVVQIALEQPGSPGPQTGIVNYKTIASTMSADSQPNLGSTGCRLLVKLYNASASGTITIAGTDVNGNAISEAITGIPASTPSQEANMNWFEYVTTNVFNTINASGITTTGLTNGTLIIDGIQAGKYLFPAILKAKTTYDKYVPDESRGILDVAFRQIQLTKNVTIDQFDSILYPNSSLWWPYMVSNTTPTVTTNPSSPTVVKASTPIATMSLSSQPNYPGQKLIFIITGSSATGSFTVTGVNQYGLAVNETITCGGNGTNGNGTYYSTHCYSSVNASGITGFTGLTGGSLQVNAVYNWIYSFVPGDAIYSSVIEWFTGSESFTHPWTLINQSTLSLDPKTGVMLSCTGISQNQLPIGSKTNSPNTPRIATLPQVTDIPYGGWQAQCYIDPIGATLGTNSFGDILNGKVMIKTPVEGGFTLTNNQLYTRQLRGRREVEVDLTIDLTNGVQWDQFRTNQLQYFTFAIYGTMYGNSQSAQYTFNIPFYYNDVDIDAVPGNNRTKANLKWTGVYDSGLGGSFIMTIQSQMPPIYPL